MAVNGSLSKLSFCWPNTEHLSDLRVCDDFAISISQKGQVMVYEMPTFRVIANRDRIPGLISICIQNNTHITALQVTRPIVYNLELGVAVAGLKRPTIPKTDRVIYSSTSTHENNFLATTTTSAICLWDIRSSENPTVVTFPPSLGVQASSMNSTSIVLGCSNSRLSLLDIRNPKQRVANFDIPKKNGDLQVTQYDKEPWMVGFQYSTGLAGVLDVMSGQVHAVKAPAFDTDHGAGRTRPVFIRGKFYVGYPWAQRLQVCEYHDVQEMIVEEVALPGSPNVIDGCDECDGIFIGCNSGEIYHVL